MLKVITKLHIIIYRIFCLHFVFLFVDGKCLWGKRFSNWSYFTPLLEKRFSHLLIYTDGGATAERRHTLRTNVILKDRLTHKGVIWSEVDHSTSAPRSAIPKESQMFRNI